jgi:hypothetical protein
MKALRPHTAPATSLSKLVAVCALSVLGAAACQNALDLGGYDFTTPENSAGSGGTSNLPTSGAGGSSSGSGKNGGSGSGGGGRDGSPGVISVSTAAGGSSGIRADDSSDSIPEVVASAFDAGPSDGGPSDASSADAASVPDAATGQCTKPSCKSGGLLLDLLGGSRADR